ncbi:UDP-N-acetylmuramoyl-L-alanyl-D-glutamate--2,6-diaminopimelate ligase [Shouchella shacheensis]|uniref:UDP-N-acetylmuramoyl-L-alanyl-D-glutamate--2, 6-diaminopimelate ligase n=1 Tax=Shouchella shacheensis TaxID=1649580 RepID=UPI00073FEDB5|nr:UDP-N-acetylmuramoyl-L-alanyl-D-glutamate--2,6-diaminopimelate ligase [Shouchella shacheensis]
MELWQLMKDIGFDNQVNKELDIQIKGITDISSNVREGYLFIAIRGGQVNGHDLIEQAVQLGACAVVGEEDRESETIPYIKVENSRKALGHIARHYYGNPSKQKVVIGITGTNGKTTTSYLVRHILEESGISCSLVGTIHNIINGEVVEAVNTTPNSLVLNELLLKSNDQVVIMEASSHGLAQFRLEGIEFDFCVFTNLTHDHLDYHGSIENYFQAKRSLFDKIKPGGKALVNTDDAWGEKLITLLQEKEVVTYSVGQSNRNDLRILDFVTVENPSLLVKEVQETVTINVPMVGIHNLYNSAMAYAVAKQLPIETEHIVQSILRFPGVEGRFEVLKQKNGSIVVIDYAHTADAIFYCLKAARDSGANRVVHLFGFRGNRDLTKREEMIKVTAEMSDGYILTMDDLNSLPMDEMVKTYKSLNTNYGNHKGEIIPDRTLAIKQAMEHSKPNDWIVITGKGHEKYEQDFKLPTTSDMETVKYINNEL